MSINGQPTQFNPANNCSENSFVPSVNLQQRLADNVIGFEQGSLEKRADGTAKARIGEFSDSLRDKGKAERTFNGYPSNARSVLRKVSKMFHGNVGLDKLDLSAITAEQIKAVEQYMYSGYDFKTASLFRIKHGWNNFCEFIGMGNWKFTRKINEAKAFKNEVISNEDVVKILQHCRDERERAKTAKARIRWLRREIAILLGWSAGLRSCEYGNAKFDEIINKGRITVRNSKHGGSREVGVTKETREAVPKLKELLKKHKEYPEKGGVFEKVGGKVYTTSTFRRWLVEAGVECGMTSDVAQTHSLRHRFADNFLERTSDISLLSRIMGHKSIDTTKGYTHPSFEKVLKFMQEANDNARGQYVPKVS